MNSEKEIVKDIAKGIFKRQKSRNVITLCAIFLMTLLITGVISIGCSFGVALKAYNDIKPGPGSDGAIVGNLDEYEKLYNRDDIEWASLLYKCSNEPVILPYFVGAEVVMFAPDDLYYKKNGIQLTDGHYPVKDNEIIISNTLRRQLKIKDENNSIELTVSLLDSASDIPSERTIDFNICGYYNSPLEAVSNVYEEIYGTRNFIDKYNPQMLTEDSNIFVKFKKDYTKDSLYNELKEVNNEVGGEGVIFKLSDTNITNIILILLAAVLLIGFASYLIVYNVFSISLANDMSFWGKLKTLGATSNQIDKILNYQIRRLFIPGAIAGVIGGNILGIYFAPQILETFTSNLTYISNTNYLIISSIIAVIFSGITVMYSCKKSFKRIKNMSPIQALRYTRKKDRKILTVISFSLSMLIFIIVYTVTMSQDIKEEAARNHTSDFTIANRSVEGITNASYRAISESLPEKLEKLDFISNYDVFYNARSLPDYTVYNGKKVYELMGRIKNPEKINTEFDEIEQVYGDSGDQPIYNNDRKMRIMALPSKRLETEMVGKKVVDGLINIEKFKTGNYILYQREIPGIDSNPEISHENLIKAGDEIKLSFFDNATDSYVDRTLTVMAIVENETGTAYGASGIGINSIIMENEQFKSIYTNYNEMMSLIKIDVDDTGKYAEQEHTLKNLLQESGDTTVILQSIRQAEIHASRNRSAMILMGGFLSLFFAIIGITNIVNTFIAEIIAQRLDYTKMQAIGMTGKQMHMDISRKNLKICMVGICICIPIAWIFSYYICSFPIFTGFLWHSFIVAVLIAIGTTGIVVETVTLYLVREITKQPIIERLRMYID